MIFEVWNRVAERSFDLRLCDLAMIRPADLHVMLDRYSGEPMTDFVDGTPDLTDSLEECFHSMLFLDAME